MQNFSIAPKEILKSLWRNRYLIKTLTEREVLGRYRGSMFGVFWSLFNPVMMLAVYTFVFNVVFKAKWASSSDSKTEFALLLFIGLLIFNIFSECIGRSPNLVLNNPNYVKKIVFPLEILPWVAIGGALFHFTVGLGVWVVAYSIIFGLPHLTIILIPLILFPLVVFIAGVSWFIASLGVFLRDISQFIGVFLSILMFLSPVFYPVSSLPKRFQFLFSFNPLTPTIEFARDVMFWGSMPNFNGLFYFYAISFLVCCLGFAWFQKVRKGFADVI